jgi:hypothetical protein
MTYRLLDYEWFCCGEASEEDRDIIIRDLMSGDYVTLSIDENGGKTVANLLTFSNFFIECGRGSFDASNATSLESKEDIGSDHERGRAAGSV